MDTMLLLLLWIKFEPMWLYVVGILLYCSCMCASFICVCVYVLFEAIFLRSVMVVKNPCSPIIWARGPMIGWIHLLIRLRMGGECFLAPFPCGCVEDGEEK